jgi:formylglycine-generating enzyme required for sulfatase activity
MVSIPGGAFMMGTEDEEIERLVKKYDRDWFRRESPQHQVKVPPFYLAKYQVTQAQWKAVAALPKMERDLKPDPSNFKGDNRPVEQVSWYDAVEFCNRLSKATGKEYRLPSEAEWEYATRGGTKTPFHFGETITSDLANYNGNYTYGNEAKGKYREETTEVGSFPPNAFGLYDMHGNVWEWCADTSHENYQGAPSDGSVWLGGSNNDNRYHVLRGGSWHNNPVSCRSARRSWGVPDLIFDYFGFRCLLARTF